MDDREAHFLILLGDAYAGAELADLRIEVQTVQGARVGGVPRGLTLTHPADGIDDSDDVHTIRIASVEIPLQDVVSFAVSAPGQLCRPPTRTVRTRARPRSHRRGH